MARSFGAGRSARGGLGGGGMMMAKKAARDPRPPPPPPPPAPEAPPPAPPLEADGVDTFSAGPTGGMQKVTKVRQEFPETWIWVDADVT